MYFLLEKGTFPLLCYIPRVYLRSWLQNFVSITVHELTQIHVWQESLDMLIPPFQSVVDMSWVVTELKGFPLLNLHFGVTTHVRSL